MILRLRALAPLLGTLTLLACSSPTEPTLGSGGAGGTKTTTGPSGAGGANRAPPGATPRDQPSLRRVPVEVTACSTRLLE